MTNQPNKQWVLLKTAVAFWAIAAGIACLYLAGCTTTPTPTKWETKFFDIQTNYIPKIVVITNVVPATNVVEQVVYKTNQVDQYHLEIVPVTNTLVETVLRTNVVSLTNQVEIYHYTPGTNAAMVGGIAGTAAAPFGWGGVVGTGMAGLFAAWAAYRNRQNAARAAGLGVDYAQSQATAAALAQIIETGRQVLQTTPQGQAIDAQWKQWMIQHQVETGTIQNVLGLLNNVVDEASAKVVASQLSSMIQERNTTPMPTPIIKA